LGDGVSRDEVDEEEYQADHQPDDRESVEDALEQDFQWQFSVVQSRRPRIQRPSPISPKYANLPGYT